MPRRPKWTLKRLKLEATNLFGALDDRLADAALFGHIAGIGVVADSCVQLVKKFESTIFFCDDRHDLQQQLNVRVTACLTHLVGDERWVVQEASQRVEMRGNEDVRTVSFSVEPVVKATREQRQTNLLQVSVIVSLLQPLSSSP